MSERFSYHGFDIVDEEQGWAIYDDEGNLVDHARSLRAAQDSIDHFLGVYSTEEPEDQP